MNSENKEKGIKAENAFAKYLDNHKIPYYHIDQNKETYSDELYHKNIRRPDYIIHTEKGIYHIDVKFRTRMNFGINKEKRFYLNKGEILSLYNFQSKLNSLVWLSFITNLEEPQFYFTPVSEVYDYYVNIIERIGGKYHDYINEIATDNHRDYYDQLWIYIPDKTLYTQLSFEKGFYNNFDNDYYNNESKNHEYNWSIKIENKRFNDW